LVSPRIFDGAEKDQAARHSAPPAVVIHEILRDEGEAELSRRPGAVFWSGLAAGLSMGFSFLAMALIQSKLIGDDVQVTLREISHYAVSEPLWPTAIKAILAGG
jgi:hypothetical protein